MKTAILQYKFNTPVKDFMIGGHDYNHQKVADWIHQNIKTADLLDAGLYQGEIDHPAEDETDTSETFVLLVITFENLEMLDNYKSDPQAIADYIYDIFEPSITTVHQHYMNGNDNHFVVAHGDAVENIFDEVE